VRVAIVIPCYNDQRFLPQALAAIGAEEATEVVVVDDGSDDPATLRLLDALAKTQVRVLHQRNAGPAAARMAGVAASQAPYALPLDADDLLGPGSLAALAAALATQPDAAAASRDPALFR